jgi:hypothetical protein
MRVMRIAAAVVLAIVAPAGVHAATQPQINQAVTDGLAWLATQQNPDGSFGSSAYPIAETGLALWAFNEHALHQGLSPLNAAYPYHTVVQSGLDYLFAQANVVATPGGDPDGNGDGAYVYWDVTGYTYVHSIAMLAIATSQSPASNVNVVASPVNGWTYQRVLQDALDFLVWGQNDGIVPCDLGGWGYFPNYAGWSDNSSTGYAVFALKLAHDAPPYGFGLTIPAGTLTALSTYINTVQDPPAADPFNNDGGSWYEPCSGYVWVNIYKTGHLLAEMQLVGDNTGTPRVQNAVAYMQNHWNDTGYNTEYGSPFTQGWKDDYQAMWTTMKGLLSLGVTQLTVAGNPVDWFDEMSTQIVGMQNPLGYWDYLPNEACDFSRVLNTSWCLLAVQKAAGQATYEPVPVLGIAGLMAVAALIALVGAWFLRRW